MAERNLTTPVGVLSYPHLQKPDSFGDGDTPKYRLTLVVTGEDARARVKQAVGAAIRAAAVETFGPDVDLKSLRMPIEPEPDTELFGDGAYRIKLASKNQPVLVDWTGNRLDATDGRIFGEYFYPGAHVRVRAWAFGYSYGRKGISLKLDGVQYCAPGEPFGGSSDPVEFDAVPEPEPRGGDEWADDGPPDHTPDDAEPSTGAADPANTAPLPF